MPNFADVTGMTIPEGEVVKITSGSTVLWEKPSSEAPIDREFMGESTGMKINILEMECDTVISYDGRSLIIRRTENTTAPTIIVSATHNTATLGDGSTIDLDTTYGGASQPTSLIAYVEDGYYFDGTYEWGFDGD